MIEFATVRLLRISWLIAATLIVTRLARSLVNWILWHLIGDTLWLPGRSFSFVPCLNGAALLAVSFATVATCDWLIQRRFGPPTRN